MDRMMRVLLPQSPPTHAHLDFRQVAAGLLGLRAYSSVRSEERRVRKVIYVYDVILVHCVTGVQTCALPISGEFQPELLTDYSRISGGGAVPGSYGAMRWTV